MEEIVIRTLADLGPGFGLYGHCGACGRMSAWKGKRSSVRSAGMPNWSGFGVDCGAANAGRGTDCSTVFGRGSGSSSTEMARETVGQVGGSLAASGS